MTVILKIPNCPKPKRAKALLACIKRAARETGQSEHLVALTMSYFLEELGEQIALGEYVLIPGFGLFGAKARQPRKAGIPAYCFPAFSGARSLKNLVRLQCPPSEAAFNEIMQHRHITGVWHDKRYCDAVPGRQEVGASGTTQFRGGIRRDARRAGVQVPPERPKGEVPPAEAT